MNACTYVRPYGLRFQTSRRKLLSRPYDAHQTDINRTVPRHMAASARAGAAPPARVYAQPHLEDRLVQETDSAGTPPLPIDQRDLERVQIRAIAVPPHFDRSAGVVERDSGDREHRGPLVDLEDLRFLLRCGSGADRLLRDPEGDPFGSKDLIEAVLLQVLPRDVEELLGEHVLEDRQRHVVPHPQAPDLQTLAPGGHGEAVRLLLSALPHLMGQQHR